MIRHHDGHYLFAASANRMLAAVADMLGGEYVKADDREDYILFRAGPKGPRQGYAAYIRGDGLWPSLEVVYQEGSKMKFAGVRALPDRDPSAIAPDVVAGLVRNVVEIHESGGSID